MKGANNVPSLKDLAGFNVNRVDQYEGIRQSLYDYTAYASAGQTSLQFFQTPEGQGGKTLADTNMRSAGQLPQPQFFLLETIEILFFPGVNPVTLDAAANAESEFTNDVYTISKSGYLELFIGSKPYLQEAPIGRFPGKTRLEAEFAVASSTTADTKALHMDYAAFAGRPYYMQPPILLVPNQNFSISLKWPAAVALPSGQDGRIGVVMDGILYRLSQ